MTPEDLVKRLTTLMDEHPETREWEMAMYSWQWDYDGHHAAIPRLLKLDPDHKRVFLES